MRIKTLATLAIILGCTGLVLSTASAQALDVPVIIDAGIAPDAGPPMSTTVTVTTTPADQIANPVDDPIGAISDASQAQKQGWPLLLLMLLVMATAGLSRACERWPGKPVLSVIARNKTLLFVVACAGAMAAGAYNAVFDGGSGYAIAYAAAGALLLFIAPRPKVV